jgi:hypothetical protein
MRFRETASRDCLTPQPNSCCVQLFPCTLMVALLASSSPDKSCGQVECRADDTVRSKTLMVKNLKRIEKAWFPVA